MNNEMLKKILAQFDIESDIMPYGNGHINDTYSCEPLRYILQRINTTIFKDPDGLMDNIQNVTDHLKGKIEAYDGTITPRTCYAIATDTEDING